MAPTSRLIATAAVAILLGVSMAACNRATPAAIDPTAAFFPLRPNMMWMYRVRSKSQQQTYTVTDMVVGSQYVPALKLTGEVVQEFCNFNRAGLRPLVYVDVDGYLTRLSGLDYVRKRITAPAWGRSIEEDFLPDHLAPDQAWSNKLFPYGKLPGGFEVDQEHKTFFETSDVVVPAGRFTRCIRIETRARYEGGAYAAEKQNLKLAFVDWYAPNVGLVRTIAYQGGLNGPEMDKVELIRFESGVKAAATESGAPHKNS